MLGGFSVLMIPILEEVAIIESLLIEPEDCEECKKEMQTYGVEYTQNYVISEGVAICIDCGRSM